MSTLVAIAYPDMATAEKVRQELIQASQSGGAALIVLGSTDARDKLLDRVRDYGGDVIQTSLSTEEEERLRAALGERAGVA
jgi:uncharacterized membrane protein